VPESALRSCWQINAANITLASAKLPTGASLKQTQECPLQPLLAPRDSNSECLFGVGISRWRIVTVRRIGNSLGVVIPKPVLAQVGLAEQAELTVERGAIVLRKPRRAARSGRAEAAQTVADQGEDELLMGEFANAGDLELDW
jgi:antitoxin MazE